MLAFYAFDYLCNWRLVMYTIWLSLN